MSFSRTVRENGDVIIACRDSLTIENVAELTVELKDALASAHLVALEFEPSVAVDITGVQLLCSACRSAAQLGKIFTYHGQLPAGLVEMVSSGGVRRSAVCKHNNNATCIWFGGEN